MTRGDYGMDEAVQALRGLLETTTRDRDQHSKHYAEALNNRGIPSREAIIQRTGAAVDALDSVLESEAAIRARRVVEKSEALR